MSEEGKRNYPKPPEGKNQPQFWLRDEYDKESILLKKITTAIEQKFPGAMVELDQKEFVRDKKKHNAIRVHLPPELYNNTVSDAISEMVDEMEVRGNRKLESIIIKVDPSVDSKEAVRAISDNICSFDSEVKKFEEHPGMYVSLAISSLIGSEHQASSSFKMDDKSYSSIIWHKPRSYAGAKIIETLSRIDEISNIPGVEIERSWSAKIER